METALVNFIEPGDKVLICINGLFGERMADIVRRCGGDLEVIQENGVRSLNLRKWKKRSNSVLPI